jgi:hypothetical protein
MKAKKIPKKNKAKKTTAATKAARKKGSRKRKAATTPVGDIMRNAAEVIQSVAKTIRP